MSEEPKSPELVVIEPSGYLDGLRPMELLNHRELLYFLVWRDLKVRYRQTLLGVFWIILQPLLMMGLYSLIFGSIVNLPQGTAPYPLFVLAGLIPWTFVSNAVSDSGNSLVANAQLINKVYFPRLFLPFARVLVLLIDFSIATLLMLVMVLGLGSHLALQALPLLFVVALLTTCVTTGAGALFSALNVKYRDFHYVIPFALQVWMFCSPIIYPLEAIPERFRWIIELNPMTGIIDIYRVAMLGGELQLVGLVYSTLFALGVVFVGVTYFAHAERKFADII